ncbi:MAG TPA: hypothetical protein VNT51_00875, partial [Miltoncostaeaceae bacterium]|nr:hypothetical protein [Miltoncostaeaceae bacterium]
HLTALAAACLAAALPASAHAQTATVRVEGAGATILPETAVALDASPVTLRDAGDADTLTVPGLSASAQLARATGAAGVPIGFQLFDFGGGPTSFVTRIGPDTMPASFSPSWRVTVNHVAGATGADQTTLSDGDRVVWAFVEDFAARELDVSVTGDVVERGRPFEVTVQSYATDGTAAPATGATVVYGGTTRTAGPGGRVTFTATGIGPQAVTATRAGGGADGARGAAHLAGDPAVCSLSTPAPTVTTPPPAAEPVGVPVAALLPDTVAPGSRIGFPRPASVVRRPAAVMGTAGPDRSDVARVEVSLARRVGTQCRFVGRRGGLGPVVPCTRRVWLPAQAAGTAWSLPLRRPLPPGGWRVWSRATDGAGNRERTSVARVNSTIFRVVR